MIQTDLMDFISDAFEKPTQWLASDHVTETLAKQREEEKGWCDE